MLRIIVSVSALLVLALYCSCRTAKPINPETLLVLNITVNDHRSIDSVLKEVLPVPHLPPVQVFADEKSTRTIVSIKFQKLYRSQLEMLRQRLSKISGVNTSLSE